MIAGSSTTPAAAGFAFLPFDVAVARRFSGAAPELRRRARLVSAFGVMGVVGGLTLAVSHLLWFGIPPEHVAAPALAGLASLLVPLVVLRRGALDLGGHLSAACWLVATSWGAFLRGGLGAPPMMCLASSAFIATSLVGRRAGLAWTGAVVLEVASVAVFRLSGGVLPDRMPEAFREVSNVLTSSLFGFLLVGMALAQEWLRVQTHRELAEAEQRKLIAENEATMARADRLASLGQLAAGVAHELSNPITYLEANLDLVDQAGLPEASRAALRDAIEAARRVRTIAGDLRTYARVDDELGPVALDGVIKAALRMAAGDLKRIAVATELGPCPRVRANETRLQQVLLNLLVNAAQAGTRELTVATFTGAGGRAVIEVRDQGEGIPPELLARVTEPFFTTKPRGVGTGLGLAICDQLVRQLGGSMTIRSAVGAGTTVSLLLPAEGGPGEGPGALARVEA